MKKLLAVLHKLVKAGNTLIAVEHHLDVIKPADWVIDLDIKNFFDAIPHDLAERAVAHHTDLPWVRLYLARWLRAPMQRADGSLEARTKGTPQGGVVTLQTLLITSRGGAA